MYIVAYVESNISETKKLYVNKEKERTKQKERKEKYEINLTPRRQIKEKNSIGRREHAYIRTCSNQIPLSLIYIYEKRERFAVIKRIKIKFGIPQFFSLQISPRPNNLIAI